MQQQISANFLPDWLTFGKMATKKTCFWPITEDNHAYAWDMAASE